MKLGQRVHMIGIGGSGMSGLAKILLARGCRVSGSDLRGNEETATLARLGALIYVGHSRANVPPDTQTIIRSAAIPDDNPELAVVPGATVLKYAQTVGILSRERETIAVSGTHGKTTTTGMLATILEVAGTTPTYLLGSPLVNTGTNASWGSGPHFVVEACEYDRSFLELRPKYLIITNIEEDHLDYYRDLEEILEAFASLCAAVPPDGAIFACVDNPAVAKLAGRFKAQVETTGSNGGEADWKVRNISYRDGFLTFEAIKYGKSFDTFELQLAGAHNASNALLAIACATRLGIGKEFIQLALKEFRGTRRRMERLGETASGAIVVDDYAHHPTEIRATLQAIRERFPDRRIWAIFQPHQRSRTRLLFKEFSRAFEAADLVFLPEIYAARDKEGDPISSRDLARAINDAGKPALFVESAEELVELVEKKAERNAVILTMGAGDIGEVARRLARSNGR